MYKKKWKKFQNSREQKLLKKFSFKIKIQYFKISLWFVKHNK